METHYWNQTFTNPSSRCIKENMFWADYAQYLVEQAIPSPEPKVVEKQP